jgi:hypothetical protein
VDLHRLDLLVHDPVLTTSAIESILAQGTMPGPALLSTDLDSLDAVPYFVWDEPMTVREIKDRLRSMSLPERRRLLGKLLREAKDTDVWRFTSPEEVAANWSALAPHLGRRRPFWEFLLGQWRKQGLLAG